MVILILMAAAAFFVFVITQKKPGDKGTNDAKSLSQFVNRTNDQINKYNNLRGIFALASQEKKEKILDCEDMESLEKLSGIEDAFNEKVDDADSVIEDIRNDLREGRAYPGAYKRLSDDVTYMESYLNEIKNIIPEKHTHEWGRQAGNSQTGNSGSGDTSDTDYFEGCQTKADLDRRYKALCKVFHPDSTTGDTEAFKNLQRSYENMAGKFNS